MDILDILYSNKDSLMNADYSDLIQNILNNKELPSNERSRLTKSATAHARKADLDRGTLDSIKKRFISFDVETTGLDAYSDRIIELGAVLYENGKETSRFSSLVNPGVSIPSSATEVNHITNKMIKNAPDEESIYPRFIDFIDDAIEGKTIIVAHNAKFDLDFLTRAFQRLGINAEMRYIDTLSISRKLVKGLDNYHLNTIADSFSIINPNAHRAVTDADTCGKILIELFDRLDAINETNSRVNNPSKSNKEKKNSLTQDELEICSRVKYILLQGGCNTSVLRFNKTGSSSIECSCISVFFEFKIAKNGRYAIFPARLANQSNYVCDSCSQKEGAANFKRVYFTNPSDLDYFSTYLCLFYNYTLQNVFISPSLSQRELDAIYLCLENNTEITDSEMNDYLVCSESKDYSYVQLPSLEKAISNKDVTIRTVNTRPPLKKPKKQSAQWYGKMYTIMERAEKKRKAKRYDEAIKIYDECREAGFIEPYLYECYSKAYHSIKDYENEIIILDEGIKAINPDFVGGLKTRRDAAIKALYKTQKTDDKKN